MYDLRRSIKIALTVHLERDEQGDCFYAVVAPVHVVTHEQVVCVRRLSADLEQLH